MKKDQNLYISISVSPIKKLPHFINFQIRKIPHLNNFDILWKLLIVQMKKSHWIFHPLVVRVFLILLSIQDTHFYDKCLNVSIYHKYLFTNK